jgi:predicted O-methyltransferase YrrM
MVDLLSILQNVTGWLSDNEALYLNQAAARIHPPNVIVEIGSFQGKSTIALALNSTVPVYAIDPHEEHTDEIGGVFGPVDRARFAENIVAAGVHERVCPININSLQVGAIWTLPIGLLFVDGAHNYRQVAFDTGCFLGELQPGGLMLIHDRTWPDIARRLQELDEQPGLRRLPDCDSIAVYEMIGE